MPIKFVEQPKCPRCSKSVYAAEEVPSGGYKFHKLCFRCSQCNKVLATHTVAQHLAEIYCKECYAKNFGGQGLGRGTGGKKSTDHHENELHPAVVSQNERRITEAEDNDKCTEETTQETAFDCINELADGAKPNESMLTKQASIEETKIPTTATKEASKESGTKALAARTKRK